MCPGQRAGLVDHAMSRRVIFVPTGQRLADLSGPAPRPKREALSAAYAYCRLIDDIVDSGSLSKDEARRMLGFWREEVERLYAGRSTHSIAKALERPVADYKIPKAAFLEMIRGCEMDLDGARYETLAAIPVEEFISSL